MTGDCRYRQLTRLLLFRKIRLTHPIRSFHCLMKLEVGLACQIEILSCHEMRWLHHRKEVRPGQDHLRSLRPASKADIGIAAVP